MRLSLNNVGRFQSATIDLNGMTVIAGANGTGKSTLSKSLYCLFNGFSVSEDEFSYEKMRAVEAALIRSSFPITISSTKDYYSTLEEISSKLFALTNKSDNSIKQFIFDISSEFNDYTKAHNTSSELIKHQQIPITNNDIKLLKTVLDYDIEKFINFKLSSLFSTEFRDQISNNNSANSDCKLELSIKNNLFSIDFSNNKINNISYPFAIKKKAIYIDDPFIIDNTSSAVSINSRFYRRLSAPLSRDHRENLCHLLALQKTNTMLDRDITQEYNILLNKIENICAGHIYTSPSGQTVYCDNSNSKNELNIVNISTGLKTFIIISQLLKNGSFEQNGTIILDEPEIHLHPEWQIVFAEILVLLQKCLNLHILLTTHSPYFLRSLQVFSEKYHTEDTYNFYLTKNQENISIIKNVNNSVDTIYKEMAKPFQILENIQYQDD